jgi:CheY-like chemotaxis protein
MAGYDFTRLSILLVDDNQHMLTIVRTILHGFGIRNVRETQDATDAFIELRNAPADLIVVDYNMSPLDGAEFTRLVRRADDSPQPYVPIIMLTAHTERHRVLAARDAGVSELLRKPVTPRDLYLRLVSVIETPRPFVRSPNYVGPCRRRCDDPTYAGPERRGPTAA